MDGRAVGLDYAALPATLWAMGRKFLPAARSALFADLQVMEFAVLDVLNHER